MVRMLSALWQGYSQKHYAMLAGLHNLLILKVLLAVVKKRTI